MIPYTLADMIPFLLTMRNHSDVYFPPAVLHTITLPSQYARLRRDSYSTSAVDYLTMDPSLDSSFGNWMPKICSKLLFDLGHLAKSGVLYKSSEIALITGCGLFCTTTTWQSFPIHFSNPPYARNRSIESFGNILGSSTS